MTAGFRISLDTIDIDTPHLFRKEETRQTIAYSYYGDLGYRTAQTGRSVRDASLGGVSRTGIFLSI